MQISDHKKEIIAGILSAGGLAMNLLLENLYSEVEEGIEGFDADI
jgi:hypothetical protein